MIILYSILLIIYMTVTSRMTGGAKPDVPWGLEQWLYAIPYGIFSYLLASTAPADLKIFEYVEPLYFTIATTILGYLGGVFGKRTGHGNFMTMPFSIKRLKEVEWGEPILRLFFDKDPRNIAFSHNTVYQNILDYGRNKLYARNIVGMAMNGMFPALLTGLLAFAVNAPALVGASILVGGALKTVGYIVPWELWPKGTMPWYRSNKFTYNYFKDEYKEVTQLGEAFAGVFGALGLIVAYLFLGA